MWKIDRIKANNIVSFRELDYSVSHGVATLIFGENLDGVNQRHNGSGKSALIEAISLALTGDYLRDIKTSEELINDAADSCSVEITLTNDFSGIVMTVKRVLSRKEAQRVEVHQYLHDEEVNQDKTVQPSVNDYNRLILSEIGLSKEDIYSNYILCRNKYVSFLSAKDKDKKELINRFSNGVIVDDSIEALLLDLHDVEEVMNERHDEVVRYQARIETVNEQIASAEEHRQSALQTRASKIADIESKIAEKRGEIREMSLNIEKADKRLDHIDKVVGDALEELEKSDKSLSECFVTILETFRDNGLRAIENIAEQSDELHASLNSNMEEIKKAKERLLRAEAVSSEAGTKLKILKEEHQKMVDAQAKDSESSNQSLAVVEKRLMEYDERINESRRKIAEYRNKLEESRKIFEETKVKLHGAITCPKCHHQFLVDSDVSIDTLEACLKEAGDDINVCENCIGSFDNDIKDCENAQYGLRCERAEIEGQIRDIGRAVLEHERRVTAAISSLNAATSEVDTLNTEMQRLSNRAVSINERINGLRKKMFDDAFDIIDSTISRGENYVKDLKDKKKFANEAIAQYEESIEQLKKSDVGVSIEALQEQVRDYQKKLVDAEKRHGEVAAQYNELKTQKEHFIQFKTYLANTKITAISQIINGFLEEIGSDIRVSIDGYRVLKSGKLSEKITVNILRDGVDGGSFSKYSCGERARVELASILAIQALTNTACDDGKGLDFLVIDEVLDGMDESGIMAAADTLNELHKTSMIITQGHVAENYLHKLVVTKENGISKIG